MVAENNENTFVKIMNGVYNAVDGPITWFRKTIVEPNRKDYYWYHQKFRRVPTIDQCYHDDPICHFEADQQFKRDKKVDSEILTILRLRYEECVLYEGPDHVSRCKTIQDQYDDATTNWFIKYGDLGAYGNAKAALMKQKHRMIWERRHGPVGTGRRETSEDV